jgi:C4-dicarboxylate-specific signal transduction histidine kinase
VAHDFSNILAVISGHSELMLRRMDPTDSLRTGAESIRKAAVWGLNLTRHVMATTRSIGPSPELVDLNVVIASVVRTLQPLLGERVDVVLRLESRLGRVNVNVVPLEQAIMNLLLNARDAMPMGGRIIVETGHVAAESGNGAAPASVMFRVVDTGFGMDAATLSRAFEPYFTTKPPGRGTGLGLATVFAFVSQSGGRVDALTASERRIAVHDHAAAGRRRRGAGPTRRRPARPPCSWSSPRPAFASSSARSSSCTATTSSPRATWTRPSASACATPGRSPWPWPTCCCRASRATGC